ncbi:MAG: hypothetical protein J7K40_02310 [candidate division Zixibacteria bacterium]|nr:hypothetical protein [candidate division Zixibacteria bacterium]
MKTLAVLLIPVFAVLACTLPALSATINIPDDYAAIQAGIDASSDGDTVLVQPGTYVENINFNGHSIVLGSLFLTTGNSSYISSTIIDGDSSGTVVAIESGEDSTCIIKGLTITNGMNYYGGGIYCINSSPKILSNIISNNFAITTFLCAKGGGIYVEESNSIIESNHIIINYSGDSGGGIYSFNADIIFHYNQIFNNIINPDYGGGGGGMICDGGSPIIANNIFEENAVAVGICGGLYIYNVEDVFVMNNTIKNNNGNFIGGIGCNGTGVISNNIINGNTAESFAGMQCGVFEGSVYNNLIYQNISVWNGAGVGINAQAQINFHHNIIYKNICLSGSGGGIFLDNSLARIYNNTISNNYCENGGGGGIRSMGLSEGAKLWNNIVWNNIASDSSQVTIEESDSLLVSYCNIQDGWPGINNIDCDPMFCNPNLDDYYLAFNSCCVGAGCDSLGNPDPSVHIGAYGIGCFAGDSCVYIPGDINGDGLVIGSDVIFAAAYFKGSGNLPPVQCYDDIAESWLYTAGDVNGDCQFIGSDITYLARYFRGEGSPPQWCPQTPPFEE